MFGSIGRFLAKRVLPTVAANLQWKIKQLEKSDGIYVWFYVEAWGFTLVDEEIKISNQTPAGMKSSDRIQLDQPIDVGFDETGADVLKRLHQRTLDQIKN